MNIKIVAKYLAYLVWAGCVFQLPAAGVALLYGEGAAAAALLGGAGAGAALGLALWLPFRKENAHFYAREGFVIAGAGWLLISLIGALPFYISGEIPSYVDALFETVSGFTTTGASILQNVEQMSRGLLFWRSFSHWLGGIGVLAFVLAIVRSKSGAGFTLHLMRAETPGPQKDKLAPKIRNSMRYLLGVYLGLSALNLVFLLAGGMPLFDAACTMFGTAGTGGFGIKANSMAGYSIYLQNVTTVFMLLFGVNFSIYFLMLTRHFKAAFMDEELRLYLGIFLLSVFAITVNLFSAGFGSIGHSLQNSAFAVSSIMTTTGFATANFDVWPQFARSWLLVLMFFGAMAGSTAGGLKMGRLLILCKSIRNGVWRLLHPNSVRVIKLNGRRLEEDVPARAQLYLCAYMGVLLLCFLLISVDGLSLEANFSAAVTCFNNVGPGLAEIGPASNFAAYSAFSKVVLTVTMLLGRLEIFPVLMLALPGTWRRKT